MTDGRPDVSKIKPFFFTTARKYHALGEIIGDAFKTGGTVNPAKAEETLKQFRK